MQGGDNGIKQADLVLTLRIYIMTMEKTMKTTFCTFLSLLMIALACPGYSGTQVAIQTSGGQIEYNFYTIF